MNCAGSRRWRRSRCGFDGTTPTTQPRSTAIRTHRAAIVFGRSTSQIRGAARAEVFLQELGSNEFAWTAEITGEN